MQFSTTTFAILALAVALVQAAPSAGYTSAPPAYNSLSAEGCSAMIDNFDPHMRHSEAEVPAKLTQCRQLFNCAMKLCDDDFDEYDKIADHKERVECFKKEWDVCTGYKA